MTDFKKINQKAREGLQLWGQSDYKGAAERYHLAITLAQEAGIKVADFHSAYAGVLQNLGQHEDASRHYRIALDILIDEDGSEQAPAVKLARYFLADHLARFGDAETAVDVIKPAVNAWPNDSLVWLALARALFATGRHRQAKDAAEKSLDNATSDDKRQELAREVQPILEGGGH